MNEIIYPDLRSARKAMYEKLMLGRMTVRHYDPAILSGRNDSIVKLGNRYLKLNVFPQRTYALTNILFAADVDSVYYITVPYKELVAMLKVNGSWNQLKKLIRGMK